MPIPRHVPLSTAIVRLAARWAQRDRAARCEIEPPGSFSSAIAASAARSRPSRPCARDNARSSRLPAAPGGGRRSRDTRHRVAYTRRSKLTPEARGIGPVSAIGHRLLWIDVADALRARDRRSRCRSADSSSSGRLTFSKLSIQASHCCIQPVGSHSSTPPRRI